MTDTQRRSQRTGSAERAAPVRHVARAAAPLDAEDRSEEEQQPQNAAAAAFARAVAGGDDKAEIQAFLAAINIADLLRTTPAGDRGDALANLTRATGFASHLAPPAAAAAAAAAGGRPPSILDDPLYIANAKALIAQPSGILGGVATTQFPDCVTIGSSSHFCCTGTLIAPRVVVTAGHCHEGGCTARIFTGPDTTDLASGQVVKVERAVPHPDFDPETLINDLTVLILEQPVAGVPPRAIAPTTAIDSAKQFRLVGYGTTNPGGTMGFGLRRMVAVPRASDNPAFGAHPGLEFVAGAPFLDRDSCRGDSGGPAYVHHQNQFFLAGATSRATSNALRVCGDGGIYVRIDKYGAFIRGVAGDLLDA